MTRFRASVSPRRLSGVTLFVLLLAAAPARAPAAVVTFEFAGEVTELIGANGLGLFGFPASVGNPFSGHFSYELGPGNPDQLPADPEIGIYDLLDFVVDGTAVSFSDTRLGIQHRPPGVSIPPSPPAPGFDRVVVTGLTSTYPGGVSLVLQAPFGAVFSDDSLPGDLSLADFTERRTLTGTFAVGIFPQPSIQDVGQITSLTRRAAVPEPTALALVAIGLAALGSRRGKSQRQ